MPRRFFDNQAFSLNEPATLGPDASRHAATVLRMKPGDELIVFNGRGGEWRARVEAVGKRDVTVLPLEFIAEDRAAALAITVALPLIKGERMDYALQKATEMGAASIRLLECRHSEVRLKGDRLERKLEHWRQVIVSACEQCGLNRLPSLEGPQPLADFVAASDAELKLIAQPGERLLNAATVRPGMMVALITGPEGGFSPEELEAAKNEGFQCFTLGERVLRAETAPVALMGALLALAGT